MSDRKATIKIAESDVRRDVERDTAKQRALIAQRAFAPSLNAVTWALLQKSTRTPQEDEKMLFAAFASAFHYLEVGEPEHLQRATWLISRVYTVLENAQEALRWAQRCLQITGKGAPGLQDYDRAFAFEAMARASGLAGNRDEARRYYNLAQDQGASISDEDNREIFLDEFKGGNWYGIRE
jgi:hypothetical protein